MSNVRNSALSILNISGSLNLFFDKYQSVTSVQNPLSSTSFA